VKEKQLNRDAEDATAAYNADLQEAFGKLAQKVNAAMRKYAADNGYTLVLDVSGNQQSPSPVLWAVPQTDVTEAVINAYNVSSGVAAPPPSAPSASRPRPSTTPKPAAPKPATPKQ